MEKWEQRLLYRRYLLGVALCGDYCDTCGDCLHCNGENGTCINGGDHTWVIDVPDLTDDDKMALRHEVHVSPAYLEKMRQTFAYFDEHPEAFTEALNRVADDLTKRGVNKK